MMNDAKVAAGRHEVISDAAQFRQDRMRAQQERDAAFERLAVYAEQNPDCFTPGERATIEAGYRAQQRRLSDY